MIETFNSLTEFVRQPRVQPPNTLAISDLDQPLEDLNDYVTPPNGRFTNLRELITSSVPAISEDISSKSIVHTPTQPLTRTGNALNNTVTAKRNIDTSYDMLVYEQWTGRVTHIDAKGKIFLAALQSKTAPDELGEFSFDDLSDDDKELLSLGAIFYWSIGKIITPGGEVSNVSKVRFRRLQHWHRKTLEKAKAQAEEYNDWFR